MDTEDEDKIRRDVDAGELNDGSAQSRKQPDKLRIRKARDLKPEKDPMGARNPNQGDSPTTR